MNGNQSAFAGIVAELTEISERLQADVDQRRAELQGIEAELRRVKQMLSVATRETAAPAKQKGKAAQARYGEEELGIILAKIRDLPGSAVEEIPGSFTVKTVVNKLGLSDSVAERAIGYLRETGKVRLVGERVLKPATRPSRIFVIDDE